MKEMSKITKAYFLKRLVDLCLRSGLSGFPKDDLDQHILLKSALLVVGQDRALNEQAINEKLRHWSQDTRIKSLDHSTLRRRLVDTGYLILSKDGSAYQVCPAGVGKYEFEAEIDQINVEEVLAIAREEFERRKHLYLET